MELIKTSKMGDYEKEKGKASYRTIVEYFVRDIVLCNNIIDVDPSVFNNVEFDIDTEIFQWYLCEVSDYNKKKAQECGLLFSYSNLLDLDVLCVDHYGTSWDYVLTDCDLVDEIEY